MMMTQTIAVERVDHIGVRVHDLDRALAFYRVLGFDLVRRPENDDVGIIRNEHGVELNLVFNANAGDLTAADPAGGRKFTKFRLFASCLFGQG
jgi:catechol 2,3-dioxygenase-like lactoylglutathione lyase family enzyme